MFHQSSGIFEEMSLTIIGVLQLLLASKVDIKVLSGQARPGLGVGILSAAESGQHKLAEAYLVEMMISVVDKREELSSSTDLRIQSWLGKAELWLKLHAHAEKTRENPGYSHFYPYQRLYKYI